MAAYPAYPILLGSSQKPEKGWRDTSSSSGTPHSKQTQGKAYSEFSLLHQLTGTEYESLLAVYAADPDTTHTLIYRNDESPAVTYTVKFSGPPQITRNIGGNKYEVRAPLRGFTD
jgi:hypothetical protein